MMSSRSIYIYVGQIDQQRKRNKAPYRLPEPRQSNKVFVGIRRSNASEAAPGHCSYSVTYSLWDRKPVHGIPHVRRDCSILFRDMSSETGGIAEGLEDPIKRANSTRGRPTWTKQQ